ncbi:MAG TPA: ATP-grasp domain-containing protein [Gemmatimonadales bacterium]|nr:ATP-grasp domain-containing protein [Gemmatimonadales bacterium]
MTRHAARTESSLTATCRGSHDARRESAVSAATKPYLLVAVTGRALAASAARSGHGVVVIDCFADRDTRALARACRSVVARRGLRFEARALLAAAAELAPSSRCAGLIFGSGFEGRVALLERLATGYRLYGNEPRVVAAVKDPRRFFPLLDRLGIRHPETRLTAPPSRASWLVKQPGGAGGAHVRRAKGRRVGPGAYYQRFEQGRSLSALFLADGRRASVIGFNEQWAVPARRGRPFLYGGAVSGMALPAALESDLRAKLDQLVAATGLIGLNGLDFLLQGDHWLVLEVNPRPTATLELYDPDYPRGLFAWHLRACEGELPDRAAPPRRVRAHAVVYALAHARVRAAFAFPRWCRDLPSPGTRLAPGDPICTVHAAAPDRERAVALVRRRQEWLQRLMTEQAA